MDTLEQAHSSTFYQQNVGNSNSHPQAPLNAANYATTPVLKQPDHLNLLPEDSPWLLERTTTILDKVEAILSAPSLPVNAIEISSNAPPNGWNPNALPPDIETYNPPPERLAEMINHLEKVVAEATTAARFATSGHFAPLSEAPGAEKYYVTGVTTAWMQEVQGHQSLAKYYGRVVI